MYINVCVCVCVCVHVCVLHPFLHVHVLLKSEILNAYLKL